MGERQEGAAAVAAVLFDFSGVIAEEGFRDTLRALADEQGADPEAAVRAGRDALHDSGYLLGHGSEARFWSLLLERGPLRGDPAVLRERVLGSFRLRPGMLTLVDQLRESGYPVGLFTNHTDWLAELHRRRPFLDRFDTCFNSFHRGRSKREPHLFDTVAAEVELPGTAIAFVDDSPEIVERARQRGWQAVHFTDEANLRRALSQLLERPLPAGQPQG